MPNQETALVNYEKFRLPEVSKDDFDMEELTADLEGIQLSFSRVKIPGGGALQFELPGGNPEDPDYAKTIEGVILYSHPANAYWQDGGNGGEENSAPTCASADGVRGVGATGGACAVCPMNAWGSGENGKTKACKNMRHIYLLRDGEYMPLQVTLPPTSLRPYSDFYSAVFASRRRGTCGSIVQLGLKRMNNGKDEYSVATFRHLYDFTGEQLARVKLYAEGFRQQIKAMLAQRERDAEAKAADADVLDYDGAIERGADGTFTIGNGDYIDERERLPA